MSIVINAQKSLREIQKEYLAHQLKRDPEFLSRRKFLGQTAAGVSAVTFMPALFSLMTKSLPAHAAPNFNASVATLNCPGGLSLCAEGPPQLVGGGFLTAGSYKSLGQPGVNLTGTGVSMTYGAPLYTAGKLYQMLESIRPTVEANNGKLYVAFAWHQASMDDSSSNKNLPGPHILNTVKAMGDRYRIMGVQVNSNSDAGGARGQSSADFPGNKPAVATTLAQAQDLLTLKKGSLAQASTNALVAAAAGAKRLTEAAAQRFQAMTSGRALAELTKAANGELMANAANEAQLDPRTDNNIATAFGITTATAATDPRVPLAASTKMLVDGLSPYMVATLQANFDYHDGTAGWDAANTGQHAILANTMRPILLAHAVARKFLALAVVTDGATSFSANSKNASGDFSPIHGAMYVFLCFNNERPTQFLLGGFRSNDQAGGTANPDTNVNLVGRDSSYEAHALVASVLGMQRMRVQDYAPSNITSSDFNMLNLFRS